MPKKKTIKIPCQKLGMIIELRSLTPKAFSKLEGILKKGVLEESNKTFDLNAYSLLVVANMLSKPEIARFRRSVEGKPAATFKSVVKTIYESIIEYYPTLSAEYICAGLNGMLDNLGINGMDDKEFETVLAKETQKQPKQKKSGTKDLNTKKAIDLLEDYLKKNIIGQNEAIEVIVNALKLKAVGFGKWVSLFFVGPTGVGKTQVAKLLAEKYGAGLYQLNCADFANGHELQRLLGAPPGYLGHTDKSLLKEKADKSNKWVFLFDEIEKAHDKFFNWLLALLDNGIVQDNIGNTLNFEDSIFIFTSNCGVRDLKTETTGFSNKGLLMSKDSSKEELLKSIKKQFSPEFRNRIDEMVFFNALTEVEAEKIAELNLKDLPVKKTPELLKYLVRMGFSPEYGARELKRAIKREIATPLANVILLGKVPLDGTKNYEVAINGDKAVVINTK